MFNQAGLLQGLEYHIEALGALRMLASREMFATDRIGEESGFRCHAELILHAAPIAP